MLPPELTYLLTLDWHVFPVSRTSKHGCFKGAAASASADIKQVFEWSKQFPDCNWRAHPGKSKLFFLDVDKAGDLHDNDGFATIQRLISKHGPLPSGPRLITGGSGGEGVFFRWEGQEMRGGPNALAPGIDVSTVRGAVCPTLPPSIHQRTGGAYRWRRGYEPWNVSLPSIPQWIVTELKPLPVPEVDLSAITESAAATKLNYYAQDIINAPSGLSNRTIFGKSFKSGILVGAGLLSYQEAETVLYHAALQRVKPEKRGGIMPSIRSGLRGGMSAK